MSKNFTSASIKAYAIIAGVKVPVTKATVSYAMNTIPFGTIVCPVGVSTRGGGLEESPAHDLLKNNKWPQPITLHVEVNQSESSAVRKHLANGEYTIFEGYVSGAAIKRTINGFTASFEITHWLSDLNHGSAISAASHPDNPSRFSFSASFKLESGGAGGTKHWTPRCLAEGIFNKSDPQEDLWEKCILKWFKALASEERLQTRGDCKVGPNDSQTKVVQKALDKFVVGEPALKFLKGYDEGIHNIWDEFTYATFNATTNRNALAGVAHTTIWDKLVNNFAANFMFKIIPHPKEARVVPFLPIVKDNWKVTRRPDDEGDYTIYAKDIDYLDTAQQIIRPVRAYMLYGGIGFIAGGNLHGGQMKDNIDDKFLGGCYVNDKQPEGMVIIKRLPRYLENVVHPNRKTKDKSIKVKTTNNQPDEAKDSGDNDAKDRKKEVLSYADKLAEFMYFNEMLKGRRGQLSGPLRFDIAPGSCVKIQGAGIEEYPDNLKITDAWAHVVKITHYLDAETPRAGTAFHLSHIHTDIEHDVVPDKHPLYDDPWKTKDCDGQEYLNGAEFCCSDSKPDGAGSPPSAANIV